MREQEIRPEIKTALVEKGMSEIEIFQNETLRPIIKMKHQLLIEVFKTQLKSRKKSFSNLSIGDKILHVDHLFLKDTTFRNKLIGIVIGQFLLGEYAFYTTDSNEINKRMNSIIKERILTNLEEIK